MGLSQYWSKFEENCYTESEDLEDLKSLPNKEALGELLKITKPAHLARLWKGIQKLQYIQQGEYHCQYITLLNRFSNAIS